MRAEIEAPFLRLRPRRGGDHGEAGEAARQLHQDRADPAGAAGDQQRARIDALARRRAESVEQQFPGGDRGQRQGCCLRERKTARFAPDDAFVDQMKFRIGALAQDRAGIEHFVAGLEQRHVRADRVHDAGGVIAEDLGLTLGRGGALAYLVIDWIGGNRLHRDADIAAFRLRLGGLEIEQRFGGIDRKRLLVADGFHFQGSVFTGVRDYLMPTSAKLQVDMASRYDNGGSRSRPRKPCIDRPEPLLRMQLGCASRAHRTWSRHRRR